MEMCHRFMFQVRFYAAVFVYREVKNRDCDIEKKILISEPGRSLSVAE